MWYRRNKLNNNSQVYAGRVYDSQLEAGDAMWLTQLEKQGVIKDLKQQVRFDCIVNGKLVCYAKVDFQFKIGNKVVWYETKGFPTDYYKLKRKLIEALIKPGEVYLVNANERTVRLLST